METELGVMLFYQLSTTARLMKTLELQGVYVHHICLTECYKWLFVK